MKQKVWSILSLICLLAIFSFNLVAAVDFNQDISDEDKAAFDQILEPVMKVYNLVKYSATVIAVVVLLFAGITYITSGSDPGKREKAKSMGMYVIVGLVVIWAAPLIVNFIVN
jgi:hypothetical protein